jgi:hypothetical protein
VICLFALNIYFNGPDPNTRLPGPRIRPIPDDILAYSVACIISTSVRYYRKWSADQHFPDDVLALLLTGIHKIAFCWEQLLAGDIADLAEGFDYP